MPRTPGGRAESLSADYWRRTHATYANLIATQEVTGGVVLGVLLLGQMPTLNSVIGAAVTLLGIALVLV